MADKFHSYIKEFSDHLRLERGLSKNTISSYCSDINIFADWLGKQGRASFEEATAEDVEAFISEKFSSSSSPRSQSRMLSALKALYRFLKIEYDFKGNPLETIDTPKLTRRLPDVLSVEEVDLILDTCNLSTYEGLRNRAILEMLYSCGLRVSELINLKISDIFRSSM